MARSNLLVMLIKNIYGPSVPDQEYIYIIKNIYSLWGQETVSSTDPYFPKNLVYPFTLRITDRLDRVLKYLETRKNAIVENSTTDTRYSAKGTWEMEICKQ